MTDHIDVSQAHRIDQSPGKLLGLLLAGLALTAIGLWMVTGGSAGLSVSDLFWGWIGLALFGSCTIILGHRFFFDERGISLTLSPKGIRPSSRKSTLIPWSEVISVEERRYRSGRMIQVNLSPGGMARFTQHSRFMRFMRPLNRVINADNHMMLSASLLQTTHEELWQLVRAYAGAYAGTASAGHREDANA